MGHRRDKGRQMRSDTVQTCGVLQGAQRGCSCAGMVQSQQCIVCIVSGLCVCVRPLIDTYVCVCVPKRSYYWCWCWCCRRCFA